MDNDSFLKLRANLTPIFNWEFYQFGEFNFSAIFRIFSLVRQTVKKNDLTFDFHDSFQKNHQQELFEVDKVTHFSSNHRLQITPTRYGRQTSWNNILRPNHFFNFLQIDKARGDKTY